LTGHHNIKLLLILLNLIAIPSGWSCNMWQHLCPPFHLSIGINIGDCGQLSLLAWPTCPLNSRGHNLKTVAPQRLPQMHNGKIIIIAYKMLMGNGPGVGAEKKERKRNRRTKGKNCKCLASSKNFLIHQRTHLGLCHPSHTPPFWIASPQCFPNCFQCVRAPQMQKQLRKLCWQRATLATPPSPYSFPHHTMPQQQQKQEQGKKSKPNVENFRGKSATFFSGRAAFSACCCLDPVLNIQ